jgi:hypothetical protein
MTIRKDPSATAGGIFLGAAAQESPELLAEEAFLLSVTDERIDIRGGSPRGTLYGVYTFLEDEFGIRFLTPDATHVPNAPLTQTLTAQQRIVTPRFAWRYSYYAANAKHPEFAVRLRNNAVTTDPRLGGRSPWNLISHSVSEYVPVSQFGKEHPEYFSLVNGRRRNFMSDDHFESGGTQPCFSNPDVRKLIIDGIRQKLAERTQTDGNISIGQNDNTMYCQCESCQEVDQRDASHMGSLLSLVNEAA